MTTARDLSIVALDVAPDHPVEQGDLSLVLAGAEVLDLIAAGALTLDGDRITPGTQSSTGDRLLDEAAASLVRQEPFESVEDWLWRRGRGLSSAYVADLERDGLTARARGRVIPLRTGRTVLVDSPDRHRAEERRASGEPVLAALASAAGIDEASAEEGRAELTGDAVMELGAVRQRKSIEDSAFDNVWRGF